MQVIMLVTGYNFVGAPEVLSFSAIHYHDSVMKIVFDT